MPNSSKTYRIAAASTDGKAINEHFGEASSFLIYDIDASGWNFVERREVKPLNGACECQHNDDSLSASVEALADCTAVIAQRIGPTGRRALALHDISFFEQPDDIGNALTKLAVYYTKNKRSVEK
jgi:predicted Fe-Mo cluster-binding NifX family protein